MSMVIKISKANKKDFKDFYLIRNQKDSIKNSLSKKPVSKSEHYEWFLNCLENKKFKHLFIAKIKKQTIGYIRYEKKDIYYVVSIGLYTKFQKLGYAQLMLQESEKKIGSKKILIADVKNFNHRSLKLFQSANFEILNKNKLLTQFVKILQKQENNYFLNLINEIEKKRKKNNINWMELLKLAYKTTPEKTKKIFKKIHQTDSQINKISKRLI